MNKKISSAVIGAVALLGSVFVGGSTAYAAVTPTLVLAERAAVVDMGPVFITATASTAGNVKFSEAGLVIKGCEAVATTTVSPFIAKCSWTPTKGGPTVLSGTLTPTDAVNFTVVDAQLIAKVGVPGQGVVSPIHIYVDTVLASGTSGPLAPRFGISCAITNEYLVGQTIVFRIYANNADQGGEPMTTNNTAKAYIEIAGVKDPLPLSYGNHAGIAFWVAVLKTGAAPLYNTLGVINYKVTMIAKDQNSMKVLSTKLVPKKVDGKRVIGDDGRTVYERVSYYRTRLVSPALKGATATYVPNWTAASLLTLFALPKA
ncbi:MAG: hypothetical protein Q8K48_04470 [Candidatus Planktophila sp.]|nr:hypothetical protein [Candidatus Planktophila sp.]